MWVDFNTFTEAEVIELIGATIFGFFVIMLAFLLLNVIIIYVVKKIKGKEIEKCKNVVNAKDEI